jgi:hypothetical protein
MLTHDDQMEGTQMAKDDFYDTSSGGVSGAAMSWNDKHSPGCYINQWRGGLVLSSTKRLATEYETKKPLYFKDSQGNDDLTRGQKKALLITVLAENERDPQDPTDIGIRTIWLVQKGRNKQVNGQWVPVTDNDFAAYCIAMEEANAVDTTPEAGGYFYLMQIGTAPGKGAVDRKLWKANYQRPTPEGIARMEQVTRPAAAQAPDSMYIAPNSQPPAAAPEAPRWQGNGQPQQTFVQPAQPTVGAIGYQQQPVPPAPQPVYAQAPPQYAPAPPMGPQHGMYGPNGGPPPQQQPAPPQQYPQAPPPPQPPAPSQQQYAGAPY